MAKKPVKIIFFDLDGTLTDSIPPAITAIQAMMKELGYPPKSAAEINTYVGFGEDPLIAGAIGSQDINEIERAKKLYFKFYKLKLKELKPDYLVDDLLELLPHIS